MTGRICGKAIDSLVGEGRLSVKVNGRTATGWLRLVLSVVVGAQGSWKHWTLIIKKEEGELRALEERLQAREGKVTSMAGSLTTGEARLKLEGVKREVEALRERLAKLEGNTEVGTYWVSSNFFKIIK